MAEPPPARVCVAAIAGAFGVRGEARVKSFTAEPEAFASYGPLETEDGARRFDARITRPVSGGFAARLSGVATREQAEALKGLRLYAARDRLPALDEDEFYHADLIGVEVFDTGGASLGRVRAVQNFGAGDVIEVVGAGRPVLLLPFTRAAVPTIDLSARRIVADPPEEIGAPEDDAEDEAASR
ncbi:ribosome maturation factor RimM [Rubrimonas sp.]|uniref:ribosome maturation factor RimM n=1 Tax=Rubrimonas sp. TaxID=2036015 RepID=UPI002FDD27A9